jgi:hypothetical protein
MTKRSHAATRAAALAVAMIGTSGAPAAAQTSWQWDGRIAPGQTLDVIGISGAIRAGPAAGPEARVSAVKTSRNGDPDVVQLVAVEHAGGVTICAVHPSRPGRPANECRAGGGGSNNVENVRVRVDFDVEVPAGVHFRPSNVSGEIRAESLSGDVRAASVSGDVFVTTAGVASATTVSGDIDVRMGRVPERGLSFTTVSGDVTVRVAGELDADIRFSTVSGRIESDFPITFVRGGGRGGFQGTTGAGGHALRFASVSGNIALRRH